MAPRRGALAALLLGAVASCGPEGSTSILPIGGYQVFAGALDDETIFKGRAWLDTRTGKREFCAEAGPARCTAIYSTAAALGETEFGFRCSDGRSGTARAFRQRVQGKPYSYAAHVKMLDGATGLVSLSPARPWFGEDLCTKPR
ncbi:MAG: hypothetical protein AAGD13_23205 [Pseudomonadota bacterium]